MEQTAGTFTEESEVVIVAEKNSDVGYHGKYLLSSKIKFTIHIVIQIIILSISITS